MTGVLGLVGCSCAGRVGCGAVDHTAGFDGAVFDGEALDVTPVGIAGVDAVEGACGALTCAGALRCGGSRRDVESGEIAERLLIFGMLPRDPSARDTVAADAGFWAGSSGAGAGAIEGLGARVGAGSF